MTRPLADALLALPPADLAGALFPLFAQHVVQGFAPQIQAYRRVPPFAQHAGVCAGLHGFAQGFAPQTQAYRRARRPRWPAADRMRAPGVCNSLR